MEPSSISVEVMAPGAISLAVTGKRFLRSVTPVMAVPLVTTFASLMESAAIDGAAAAFATSAYIKVPALFISTYVSLLAV